MSLQPFVPWLLIAAMASVATMVWGAGSGDGLTIALAATGFAAVAVAVSGAVNYPYWQSADEADAAERVWAPRRNARLFMFVYAWGASAIAAIYSLTALAWRHDWQYALAMAIAAVVCFVYAEWLVRPASMLARPEMLRAAAITTMLQGAGAIGGTMYVVLSGKLWTYRSDWAANQVFVVGGLLLALLSLLALVTYSRMQRNP